ncbi:calcium-binding and coiled-coil domain-containing protein 1b isoform X4 [Pangasianodon hypophthalmus]|uniref:calcium-binding and coiled-coil domain-containing protein 1b isoform X4 n=1 Tax=Pangasianodon hypophthalmus TaxID=310915 RepID=UPI002307EB6F|nr:calcium-binding and coiled-coil domain-containing protein 1b isoform X4 [Pangasianodon hypophthalmus]
MEKEERWKVKFRNVAQTYFPQTRVECRYTLTREHNWSCRDWIGLFKVGWTSVRDYHTYIWALAPEDYSLGKDVNCSILFHPSYLPSPGPAAYQFVYVDELGEICAVSPQFTFSAPKPLDELVTLEEERNGEEENEGEDLLLVVPRAQILQSHLEACQKELSLLQKKLGASSMELEKHTERIEMERKDFEMERAEMRNEIKDLRERLRCSIETIERMEDKQKMEGKHCREEMRVLQERLENSERSAEALRRNLSELGALQNQNQAELHQIRLQAAQMALQLSQANLSLREGQAAWAKERENLRKNAELDKEQVQKLSHELQKKEEWLQEERTEREKLELELGNEKACNRVNKPELRASVRAMQKEREQLQLEKQELLDHIRVFRLRMERERDAAWAEAASGSRIVVNSDGAAATLQKSDSKEAERLNLLQTEEPEENKPTEQETHSTHTDVGESWESEPQTPSEIKENAWSEFADAPLW